MRSSVYPPIGPFPCESNQVDEGMGEAIKSGAFQPTLQCAAAAAIKGSSTGARARTPPLPKRSPPEPHGGPKAFLSELKLKSQQKKKIKGSPVSGQAEEVARNLLCELKRSMALRCKSDEAERGV